MLADRSCSRKGLRQKTKKTWLRIGFSALPQAALIGVVSEENPHPKAALRSEAFARALENAQLHMADPERLRALLNEAGRKAASVPRDAFKENWPYLQAILRCVRAHSNGEYRLIEDDAMLWIVAALNYLVDPFDLIPDEVPFLGFVDDATVVEFAVSKTRQALDEFMIWETTTSRRE
jgi:uncharacterized membrane protein YkvA (DUF1232 family)